MDQWTRHRRCTGGKPLIPVRCLAPDRIPFHNDLQAPHTPYWHWSTANRRSCTAASGFRNLPDGRSAWPPQPCNHSISTMVRDFAIGPYLRVKQERIVKMKDLTMNTQPQFNTHTQAEIQMIIHRAHRMRSEYLGKLIKDGFSNLRGVFRHKKPVGDAAA